MATAKHCASCQRAVEPRRKIGVGTFLLAFLTAGIWLFAIPFYQKRCPTCWGQELTPIPEGVETTSQPSPKTVPVYLWLAGALGFLAFLGILLAENSSDRNPSPSATTSPRLLASAEQESNGSSGTLPEDAYGKCKVAAANKWVLDFTISHSNTLSLDEINEATRQVKTFAEAIRVFCGDNEINNEILQAAKSKTRPQWIASEIDVILKQ